MVYNRLYIKIGKYDNEICRLWPTNEIKKFSLRKITGKYTNDNFFFWKVQDQDFNKHGGLMGF